MAATLNASSNTRASADAGPSQKLLAEVEAKLQERRTLRNGELNALRAEWLAAIAAAQKENSQQRQQIAQLQRELEDETRRRREAESQLTATNGRAGGAGATGGAAASGAHDRTLAEALTTRDVALERVALLEAELARLRDSATGAMLSRQEAQVRAEIDDARREQSLALEEQLRNHKAERDSMARENARLQIELSHAKETLARLSQRDGRESAARDNAVRERDRLLEDLAEERRRADELREETARLQLANSRATATAAPTSVAGPATNVRYDAELEKALRTALTQRDEALALLQQLQDGGELAKMRDKAEQAQELAQRYQLLVEDLRAQVAESRRRAYDQSVRASHSAQAAQVAIERTVQDQGRLREQLREALNRNKTVAVRTKEVPVIASNDAASALALLVGKQREIDTCRVAHERLQRFAEDVVHFCQAAGGRRGGGGAVTASQLLQNAQLALQESSMVIVDELPRGWERRRTELGLVFYVNHRDRYSTWLHPVLADVDMDGVNPYGPYDAPAGTDVLPLPQPMPWTATPLGSSEPYWREEDYHGLSGRSFVVDHGDGDFVNVTSRVVTPPRNSTRESPHGSIRPDDSARRRSSSGPNGAGMMNGRRSDGRPSLNDGENDSANVQAFKKLQATKQRRQRQRENESALSAEMMPSLSSVGV